MAVRYIVIHERCPQCGSHLKTQGSLIKDLGPPFLTCGNCKTELFSPSNREWEMLGSLRGVMIFRWGCLTLWLLVFLGFGPAFAATMFLRASLAVTVTAGVAVAGVVAAMLWVSRIRLIRASQERMADPEYPGSFSTPGSKSAILGPKSCSGSGTPSRLPASTCRPTAPDS